MQFDIECLRFSSDADNVRLTNVCIIIIISGTIWHSWQFAVTKSFLQGEWKTW